MQTKMHLWVKRSFMPTEAHVKIIAGVKLLSLAVSKDKIKQAKGEDKTIQKV